ncbi:hypothetical protein [uncultured Sphingopyxis sp.]|jgi:hypothetical protein|uniref:hypothetical protein n=1 Tax=uncultured Sphingopyxis sp. TaxID=310581 RepID=UPI000A48420E|nr:hypothetical protein [uncultured Sphingopyxis sp.]
MADLPTPILILVLLASIFSVAAGVKAVWHNCQLRRGGERPLGLYSQLRSHQKGDRP